MRASLFLFLLLISASGLAAESKRIAYSDIEGDWYQVGAQLRSVTEIPGDACANLYRSAEGELSGSYVISIRGRLLSGYEFSCNVSRGNIRGHSTIVLRTICGVEGEEMRRAYTLSRRGKWLIAKIRETNILRPREKASSFTEIYERIVCDEAGRVVRTIAPAATSDCPWSAASFRSRPYQGRQVEVQFGDSLTATGTAILRGLGHNDEVEWIHQAEYSCSNGIVLCGLSLKPRAGVAVPGERENSLQPEIIAVNSDREDADEERASIVVLAGIPLYFRGPVDGIPFDIQFTHRLSAAYVSNSIYVPEIYYFHRCN